MSLTDDDVTAPRAAALRDLLQSEGWAMLREYLGREYGPSGYGRAMQAAIAKIPQGPDRPYELAKVAEQVDATARAVNDIVLWPENELKKLQSARASRRPFAALRRTGG